MHVIIKLVMTVLTALSIGLLGAGAAQADPGCYSPLPWSVCNQPWNNYMPGQWDFNPKPGQWGPGGYHYCDYSEGCGK